MIDAATIFLIGTGLVIFFGTVVGILRLPDFYSRMHAAGKADTLSSLLLLMGLAVYQCHTGLAGLGQEGGGELMLMSVFTGLKILMIAGFIFIASPTATHMLINAGWTANIAPWQQDEDKEDVG